MAPGARRATFQSRSVAKATREFPSPFDGRQANFGAGADFSDWPSRASQTFCSADLASITWMPLCRLTSCVTCMSAYLSVVQ